MLLFLIKRNHFTECFLWDFDIIWFFQCLVTGECLGNFDLQGKGSHLQLLLMSWWDINDNRAKYGLYCKMGVGGWYAWYHCDTWLNSRYPENYTESEGVMRLNWDMLV